MVNGDKIQKIVDELYSIDDSIVAIQFRKWSGKECKYSLSFTLALDDADCLNYPKFEQWKNNYRAIRDKISWALYDTGVSGWDLLLERYRQDGYVSIVFKVPDEIDGEPVDDFPIHRDH